MSGVRAKLPDLPSRQNRIRRLLGPLTRTRQHDRIACYCAGQGTARYLLAAYDGKHPAGDYRKWRFSTFVPGMEASYFEHWGPTQADGQGWWYLERAYLHIYKVDRRAEALEEAEYICLHCDPAESDDAPQARYRRGPHLHIEAAPDPLPRAHIALCNGYLDEVLSSAACLFEAMERAVLMVRDEVLERLR